MEAIYSSGSPAGSNKIVVNPASGGDSQRRALVWPTERTRPNLAGLGYPLKAPL